MVSRQQLVLAALGLQGVPYQYGGQLYRPDRYGTDCSGLIADAFFRSGDTRLAWLLGEQWAARTYAERLPQTTTPLPGDAWIYGDPVSHITLHLGEIHLAGLPPTAPLLLNAANGGSDVLTLEVARARKARVVLLPVALYHQRRPPRFAVSLAQFYAQS